MARGLRALAGLLRPNLCMQLTEASSAKLGLGPGLVRIPSSYLLSASICAMEPAWMRRSQEQLSPSLYDHADTHPFPSQALWALSAAISLHTWHSALYGDGGGGSSGSTSLRGLLGLHLDAASGAAAVSGLWSQMFLIKALLVFDASSGRRRRSHQDGRNRKAGGSRDSSAWRHPHGHQDGSALLLEERLPTSPQASFALPCPALPCPERLRPTCPPPELPRPPPACFPRPPACSADAAPSRRARGVLAGRRRHVGHGLPAAAGAGAHARHPVQVCVWGGGQAWGWGWVGWMGAWMGK
jgi:hypothetical protein